MSDFYPQETEQQTAKRVKALSSHKMDKLTERISSLTIPREKEIVPEGLVDSMPPEGI